MPDVPPQAPSRRLVILSSLSLACGVVLLFGLWPPWGGDLFEWLTVGRYTWQHGVPPYVDVFSYTTPGVEFIAHSWLAGLVFYLIEQSVGWVGYGLLRLVLVSTALAFALRTARLLGASWSAITLVAPVVLGLMWARLELRPHLFTSALLAGQLWLMVSVHLGHRDWRWLFVLAPLYTLAINLHAGWIQLPIMLLVFGLALTAMEARRRWQGSGAMSHLSVRHLALVLVACGCALLINPYGWRLLYFPFEMQADWIRANGSEWQGPWGNPVWSLVGGGQALNLEAVFWIYAVAVVGMWLVAVRRWRVGDLVPVAVMAFWLAMSLRHVRAVSDAVLLTAPFIAAALPVWRVTWPAFVGIGLTLGVAALSLPLSLHYFYWWTQPYGVGDCLTPALSRLGISGRVYTNELNHWLLYLFHPSVRVDGTWEFIAGQQRWAEIRAGRKNLPEYLARYQVDAVVLTDYARKGAFAGIPVMVKRGWAAVHMDGDAVILVPNRPDTADLIEREGYYWLAAPGREPSNRTEALQELAEANRALRHCPTADFAWRYKAYALRYLGFHDEAADADRTAKSLLDAMPVR